MDDPLDILLAREAEESEADEYDPRPVAMPGSGAPVLKIGEGCFLTLPTNPD
jgi:hypothetical protein